RASCLFVAPPPASPLFPYTTLFRSAAAHIFKKRSPAPKGHGRHKIVIGKDTRLSGYMLENAIASGILSMGVDVLLIGPLPTPGVDRKSTRLNSSHEWISYAVFCLKK